MTCRYGRKRKGKKHYSKRSGKLVYACRGRPKRKRSCRKRKGHLRR